MLATPCERFLAEPAPQPDTAPTSPPADPNNAPGPGEGSGGAALSLVTT
jgi:hypothetical protein